MKKQPKILVVGSLVMDMIISAPRFPQEGESVFGTDFRTAPGGKGANQAVQAARLGADVTMVGRVGNDSFGVQMIAGLRASGVNTDHILITDNAASAIANVQLETHADGTTTNRIIVVPGANMMITPEDVAFLKEEISSYDIVMLQYEIPMQINEIVAEYAAAKGVPVMINTAPSAPTSDALLTNATYISPNEHEAQDLTGISVYTEEDAKRASEQLLGRGVRNVIITRGVAGATLMNENGMTVSPSVYCDHVADPTAAGDSFVGAFCTALCAGAEKNAALRFANYTAHLTVSRMGAQPSLPTLAEVLTLMHAHDERCPFFA